MSDREYTTADLAALATLPILSFEQAAALAQIPFSTFDVLCRRGDGPLFVKIGRHRRSTPAEITRWMQSKIQDAHDA